MGHRVLLSALVVLGISLGTVDTPTAQPVRPDISVVVSATRSDTTLAEMPMYTTIITQEQIRNSPAQTLDQLLRQVPGINLPGAPYFETDPTGNQIRMRGATNAIRSLPASERDRLVQDLPKLFPELDGDAAWERIIHDDRPRPALSHLLDAAADTRHPVAPVP